MTRARAGVATLLVVTTLGADRRPRRAAGLDVERILAAYVLALAAIALAALTRVLAAGSTRHRCLAASSTRCAADSSEPGRPAELVRIEREITLGTSSAGHLHYRLAAAAARGRGAKLAPSGFDLERRPGGRARPLGDDAWELLRPDRPAAGGPPAAPACRSRRVAAVVDALERL